MTVSLDELAVSFTEGEHTIGCSWPASSFAQGPSLTTKYEYPPSSTE
jgi:hypothetical protein